MRILVRAAFPLGMLSCAMVVHAAEANGDEAAPALKVFSQALVYGSALVAEDSDFNPDNALARLPRREGKAELRIDTSVQAGPCTASAKLRGRYRRGSGDESHALFLNQGGLRCRAGGEFELSAGRDVLQWGSSVFLSPSNPFFIDTGKTNPIQELAGKDMLQAHWFASHTVTVSLIRNQRHGAQEPDPQNFAPVSALKADWIGDGASGGAIVSRRDDGVRRLGLYGTLPWSKALLLYAEANAGRGSAGHYAVPSSTGWRFTQNKLDSDKLFHTVLAGAAYTFESGWTLSTEWLSGNEGYDRAERAAYQAAASGAARLFPLSGSAGLLGAALAPNLPYLGENYLFLQLLRTEWNDKGDVALRWTRALGAGDGALLAGSFTWYLGNHAQLFLVASRNHGGGRSDFGRLVRTSVQTGVRFTF